MAESNKGQEPANTNGWSRLPDMSSKRDSAAGVWVNDHQFLAIGGRGEKSLEFYDTDTKKWSNFLIDMPIFQAGHGAVVVGNRLFVIGGEPSSNVISIDISGNDLSTISGNWETMAPMKQRRYHFARVSDSRYIYVFGGWIDGYCLKSAERYDTQTKTWTSLPDMPGARRSCGAGMVGDKIYVVGGRDTAKMQAATFIYDTVNEKWETGKDMITPRSSLSVVTVDRFLVAIGGHSGVERLSSIEVLDTQRNVWSDAPTRMTAARNYFAAGYLQATDQIIVAGGYEIESAEIITFENGILPHGFRERLKERGQKVIGDTDRGDDQLECKIIAEALAESLLFKDLTPPFVLGVLGKWGRGKSFFFNLMLDRMIKIQKTPAVGLVRETYAGHIYVVKFDAWTFSKGCVFSSFMYEILKTLNEVLQFEAKIMEQNEFALINGDVSTIEVFRDLSARHRTYIQANKKVLKQYKKYAKQAKKNGEFASEELLKAINSSYKNDEKELKRLDELIQAKATIKRLDGTLNIVGKWILDKALERALKANGIKSTTTQNLTPGDFDEDESESEGEDNDPKTTSEEEDETKPKKPADEEGETKPEENKADSGDDNDDIGKMITALRSSWKAIMSIVESIQCGCRSLDEKERSTKALLKKLKGINFLYYKYRLSNVPPFALICSAAFAIATVILFVIFKDQIDDLYKWITGALSILTPVITAAYSVAKIIEPVVKEIGSFSTALSEELEAGAVDDDELIGLKRKKTAIQNRTLALKGISLRDTIANKIDVQAYQNNLGIVHKVQQDLQLLSDGMLNERQQKIFPRGRPRIVLFVDDLDRCNKDNVVEVIEALQLLVKTKLFVAILAIDPRYVTTSIESHYKGILDPQTPPSGMDFLEKIIQIPFRLPGVHQNSLDSYVGSQIAVEPDSVENIVNGTIAVETKSLPEQAERVFEEASNVTSSEASKEKVIDDAGEGDNNVTETTDTKDDEKDDSPRMDASSPPEDALPKNEVLFTQAEAKMMKEVIKLFGLGPRCIKRIVNVFKILQVIWQRRERKSIGQDSKVDLHLKRATLFLMLMAADESTRDVTYTIFDWMDSGRVKYHHVALEDGYENCLADVIKNELKDYNKAFALSFSERNRSATKKGTLINFVEEYLSEYKWKEFDEWSQISAQFMLARCFSFYRVTSEEESNNEEK